MKPFAMMAGAAVLLLAAGAVEAKPIVYECTFKGFRPHSGLSSPVFFSYDPKAGVAVALDGAVKYYYGGPIAARVTADNDRRTSFRYEIKNAKAMVNGIGNTSVAYHRAVTVRKPGLEAVIYQSIDGADSQDSGWGKCVIRQR